VRSRNRHARRRRHVGALIPRVNLAAGLPSRRFVGGRSGFASPGQNGGRTLVRRAEHRHIPNGSTIRTARQCALRWSACAKRARRTKVGSRGRNTIRLIATRNARRFACLLRSRVAVPSQPLGANELPRPLRIARLPHSGLPPTLGAASAALPW